MRTLAWDSNYFAELALMHPDAMADAVALDEQRVPSLRVCALSPVDLAVSKIARFTDQDRGDITALAEAGLLTAEALEQRAEEALAYCIGDLRWVRLFLAQAVEIVRDAGRTERDER